MATVYDLLRVNTARDQVVFRKLGVVDGPGVYRMNGDGSGRTGPFPFEDLVALSGDGTRLAGIRQVVGEWTIVIGNLETGALSSLPVDGISPIEVFWSRRSDRVGFIGQDRQSGMRDIFSIRTDGEGFVRVTDDAAHEYLASWSPDGAHIAFTRVNEGLYTFHSVRPDGSDLRRLLFDTDCIGADPAWSPDGRWVICTTVRGRVAGIVDVYSRKELPLVQEMGGFLSWSPDGTRLLSEAGAGVATMNPDGSGLVFLAPGEEGIDSPVWLRAREAP